MLFLARFCFACAVVPVQWRRSWRLRAGCGTRGGSWPSGTSTPSTPAPGPWSPAPRTSSSSRCEWALPRLWSRPLIPIRGCLLRVTDSVFVPFRFAPELQPDGQQRLVRDAVAEHREPQPPPDNVSVSGWRTHLSITVDSCLFRPYSFTTVTSLASRSQRYKIGVHFSWTGSRMGLSMTLGKMNVMFGLFSWPSSHLV